MNKILLLIVMAIVLNACQEATQPTNLTATRTISVEVRNNKREPVPDATVTWLKYTGVRAPMSGQKVTGQDGFAQFPISDIATRRDSIRLTIDPPNRDPYSNIDPVVVNMSVCTDTLISLSLINRIACGATSITDTITMEACPETGQVIITECRFYPSDCPPGLIFTIADSGRDDIQIRVAPSGTNTSAAMVCADFTPSSVDQPEQTFNTVIEGRDPASNVVQLRIALTVIGRVNCEDCPCPEFIIQQFTTRSICVGNEYELEMPLDSLYDPMPGGSDCIYEFSLEEPIGDASFTVLESSSFMLRGGQTLPRQVVRIKSMQPGSIQKAIKYRVSTRRTSGGSVSDCPAGLVTNITIPVLSGLCRVEPLVADTLRKCVFSDSSTTDTVYLVNDGDCDVTFNVDVDRSYYSISPSGSVLVEAKKRVPIIIRFNASKVDWDNNPAAPSGPRGEKPFKATLMIRGCDTVDVELNGVSWAICSAFKYQCLRQFRPPSYPDVYAESIQLVENKTDIIYQNDNQNFKVYDIFVKDIAQSGGSYTVVLESGKDRFGSNYGRFYKVASGFLINPGQSVCDTYPAVSQAQCNSMKSDPSMGQNPSVVLSEGDIVLFVKEAGEQCALIWIQSIAPDRPGPNSLPAVCIEICYPVFTL